MTDAAKKTEVKKVEADSIQDENPNWSAWYVEGQDRFAEFDSFDPSNTINADGMGGASSSVISGERHMSARQISGMLEGEKAADDRWAEDWNDEDAEDAFDRVAEKCGLAHGDKNVAAN